MCKEEKAFLNKIKNVHEKRNHKIKGSYGVYDGYKYYRKIKPKNSEYIISESQYFSIIRKVNKLFIENLLNNEDISFPHKMGKLELKKRNSIINIENGKIKTNLPVDWDSTLKLWFSDKEAYNNKVLLYLEEKELFKIHYNKTKAVYNNKTFYDFNVNRELKIKLKEKIKEGAIDAFYYNHGRTISEY